jgi:division protein 1
VKCIQVEDNLCLTGSEDGSVRLWDLRLVDDNWEKDGLSDVAEEDASSYTDGELVEKPNSIRSRTMSEASTDTEGPCVRIFDGHSQAVTSLYFEDECLVNRVPSCHVNNILTLRRSPVRPTRRCASGTSALVSAC